MLDRELETYEREKAGLLASHAGKYVLIKDDKVIGTYESQNDAINEGEKLFPGQPILTKRIEAVETFVYMPMGNLTPQLYSNEQFRERLDAKICACGAPLEHVIVGNTKPDVGFWAGCGLCCVSLVGSLKAASIEYEGGAIKAKANV